MAPGRGGLRFASAAMTPVLKAISSVVGSDALTGVAAFLRAIDGMETEFSRRALAVASTLRGDGTHFVVVTAPSPDALQEADHFVSELARIGISLRIVVANRMPPRFGPHSAQEELSLAESKTGNPAILHALVAALNDDAERAELGITDFVRRTRVRFPAVPIARSTELAEDIHSMDSISVLARQLADDETRQ
jgi:arsenite-transporting ATPase